MIGSLVKNRVQTQTQRSELFEKLVDRSYRQAYSMAFRLAGNRSEAEDLLQETYVRAFRFFHRYNQELPFNSWLYRIMTNIHIDNVRRKGRIKTVSIHQPTDGGQVWEFADKNGHADAKLLAENFEEPFHRALLAMNPEFRTAVLLADIEGMSYEEIAEVMETSVGTVRSRIHRGRRQLRNNIETISPQIKEEYLR